MTKLLEQEIDYTAKYCEEKKWILLVIHIIILVLISE